MDRKKLRPAKRFWLLTSCILFCCQLWSQDSTVKQPAEWIPAGGNSWMINAAFSGSLPHTDFRNWNDSRTVCRTFFRINKPGRVHLLLKIHPDKASRIRVRFQKTLKELQIQSGDTLFDAGSWNLIDTGYVHVDLQGIQRTGKTFGAFEGIMVSGNASLDFVRNNEDNYFYWGRRGPSVHLNYSVDTTMQVEWFYNEITVPANNDVVGSYYMANGFGEGYFGMQVNSKTERRILFSIWSPYTTDDPAAIPDSLKIRLLAKGDGVHTGEFGNEGSGGQSFWRFLWKAGNTYRFLTRAEPLPDHSTIYTSWFFAPELGNWKLIASFKRPVTSTYLKRLHSFLENFEPETGLYTRKVLFSEQWAGDGKGGWVPLTTARFTVDQTGRKHFRNDFAGGVSDSRFYLKNDGFFDQYVLPGTIFNRSLKSSHPLTPELLNRFCTEALNTLKAAERP